MTSSGGEPKIYLRGVTPLTLIHGGLGHRPLLVEELDLIRAFIAYISVLCPLSISNVVFFYMFSFVLSLEVCRFLCHVFCISPGSLIWLLRCSEVLFEVSSLGSRSQKLKEGKDKKMQLPGRPPGQPRPAGGPVASGAWPVSRPAQAGWRAGGLGCLAGLPPSPGRLAGRACPSLSAPTRSSSHLLSVPSSFHGRPPLPFKLLQLPPTP